MNTQIVRRMVPPVLKHSIRLFGYAKKIGWFQSAMQGKPVDGDGKPIPWLCYWTIHLLDQRINREMTVFEYGCGQSTLWWSARVANVVSCEHDPAWYEKMRQNVPANVQLIHHLAEPDGAYARAIADFPNLFDIVVIDGRDRVNCARQALLKLKNDGIIIWDNSDRPEYEPGMALIQENGFSRLGIPGMLPGGNLDNHTTIFYRQDNCLGL